MADSMWRDATVTGVSPLRVRLDGDESVHPSTPDALVSNLILNVDDRVRCEITQGRLIVHGRAGGLVAATTSVWGLQRLATNPETLAGVLGDRVVSPAGLKYAALDRITALESLSIKGVIPSSVVVGSGSATVAADGTVTFTAVSTLSLIDWLPVDGVYLITCYETNSAATGTFTRARNSLGSDIATSVYNYIASGMLSASGPSRSTAFGVQSFMNWKPTSGTAGDYASGSAIVTRVGGGAGLRVSNFHSWSSENGDRRSWSEGGDMSAGTTITGLTIRPSSGTMTGFTKCMRIA